MEIKRIYLFRRNGEKRERERERGSDGVQSGMQTKSTFFIVVLIAVENSHALIGIDERLRWTGRRRSSCSPATGKNAASVLAASGRVGEKASQTSTFAPAMSCGTAKCSAPSQWGNEFEHKAHGIRGCNRQSIRRIPAADVCSETAHIDFTDMGTSCESEVWVRGLQCHRGRWFGEL